MTAASDPVASGYAQSLGRPGRNFTGLSLQVIDTTGKRLELLKGLVPVRDVSGGPPERQGLRYWHAAEAAARARGWKLVSSEFANNPRGSRERPWPSSSAMPRGALIGSRNWHRSLSRGRSMFSWCTVYGPDGGRPARSRLYLPSILILSGGDSLPALGTLEGTSPGCRTRTRTWSLSGWSCSRRPPLRRFGSGSYSILPAPSAGPS